MSMDPARGAPDQLKTVHDALDLIELLAEHGRSMGITEISRATGMSRTKVARVVYTLAARGWVDRDRNRHYSLGVSPIRIGNAAVRRLDLRQVARPVMEQIARQLDETVMLVVPAYLGRVCIDKVDSSQTLRTSIQVGEHLPYHAGSSGKVLLAYMPEERAREILERAGLPRVQERTVDNPEELFNQIRQVREQGYAVTTYELTDDASGMAVPLRNATGEVVAALSVLAPAQRLDIDAALPILIEAGHDISRRMGHS